MIALNQFVKFVRDPAHAFPNPDQLIEQAQTMAAEDKILTSLQVEVLIGEAADDLCHRSTNDPEYYVLLEEHYRNRA